MIKVIPHDAWSWDAPQVVTVKVSAFGFRGHDMASFVKRASHPQAQWIRDNPPQPGEVYVHSIALGSHEKVGGNRNGDSYSDKMLGLDHRTFEKHARWYYNHKNDNPEKSYGVCKHAHYDPELGRVDVITALNGDKEAADRNGGLVAEKTLNKMASNIDVAVSQSCFPPGELVMLADGRQVPIETVGHGDEVVTHLGNVKPVGHSVVIPYDGNLVRLRSSGLPGVIRTTADHKIWVRPAYDPRRPCPVCAKSFRRLACHLREQAGNPAYAAVRTDYGRAAEGWRRADEIKAGDYVRTPFDTAIGEDRGDPEYAAMLGYYAAEGNVYEYARGRPDADWRQGLDFTFAKDEVRYAKRVVSAVKRFGGVSVSAGVPKARKSVYHVRVSGRLLRSMVERDVGRYSYAKQFSAAVMRWAPENQLVLLGAFFDGDGTWHKTNERLSATTTSEVMARQLTIMCWRNNIPASLNRLHPPAHRAAGKRPYYTVEVSGRYATLIPTDKVPRGYAFAAEAVLASGHLRHHAPDRIVVRRSSDPLTYVESGFAYHRVTKVETERYVGPVHNFGVADDESYVVGMVAVKNCKVPVDVCMSCGNKARNRSEYCGPSHCKYGGCKDNLGRVFDDGFHLTVDNPRCTFFDLSDVSDTRGADRTAFITGKAAGVDRVVGGAELAEVLGLVQPDHLLDPNTLGAVRCLRKLAGHAYPDVPAAPTWEDCLAVRGSMNPYKKQAFVDDNGHETITATMAAGVVLPPAKWLSLATGVGREKCAAAFAGPIDVTRDLLDRPDVHEVIAAAAGPSDDNWLSQKWAWAVPTANAHAAESARGVLAGERPATKAAFAQDHPMAAECRARYLAYQGRLLAAHENSRNFTLLLSECNRHNRCRTL